MKIAVLVYGRLEKCANNYANILENIGLQHELDFFVSSDNSVYMKQFIKMYKPKLWVNDPIKYTVDFGKYPTNRPETNIHNMTCHFINKQRVFELFKGYNGNYDVVLSLRIDLHFDTPFTFEDIQENTVYIPCGSDWGGINDQLAYGTFETMAKYHSIFENCVYLLESGTVPHPETLNSANIIYNKLNIIRFPMDYYIKR
jgi:hypothetical protein